MNELLAAATRMCTAIAVHYEKLNGTRDLPLPAAPAETAHAKPRKAIKAPKSALTPGMVEAATAPAPVAVVLTEEESTEKLRVTGEAFVQAFSKNGNPVKEVGEILESRFKVKRLRELNHAQRVELIGILEGRIREKDAAPTQAAAPAAPAAAGMEI